MTDTDIVHNLPEVTVSELSGALKRTVESAFSRVRVRGEISQPKVAASGHCYLRLKDDQAVIDAIIWKGTMVKLPWQPEEGMEIVALGRLTTYPGRSSYQIIIESFDLAGEGALLKLLEDRRKRLAAEGLFDAGRKRALPFLPEVIGVVTSPTGAVIRDILHRLADRFPRRVIVWPVPVQGEGAAAKIAQAIAGFNALGPDDMVPRPDLLIVARGGGSLEDLMAFNEESVVRAVAASQIPVISAVGHETDVTLIDHAADRRAPTPTGAAEIAVPVRSELRSRVLADAERLERLTRRVLDDRAQQTRNAGRGLPDLERLLEPLAQRLDEVQERMSRAVGVSIEGRSRTLQQLGGRLRGDILLRRCALGLQTVNRAGARLTTDVERSLAARSERLTALGHRLESVSHKSALARGYVLVRRPGGPLVTRAEGIQPPDVLDLVFQDGHVAVQVISPDHVPSVSASPSPPAPSPAPVRHRAKAPRPTDDRQSTLFDFPDPEK